MFLGFPEADIETCKRKRIYFAPFHEVNSVRMEETIVLFISLNKFSLTSLSW